MCHIWLDCNGWLWHVPSTRVSHQRSSAYCCLRNISSHVYRRFESVFASSAWMQFGHAPKCCNTLDFVRKEICNDLTKEIRFAQTPCDIISRLICDDVARKHNVHPCTYTTYVIGFMCGDNVFHHFFLRFIFHVMQRNPISFLILFGRLWCILFFVRVSSVCVYVCI